MHRHRLDHDHRRAADGAFLVVAAMAFSRQTQFGHIGGMRAENDTIVELTMTQLDWLEQILVLSHKNAVKMVKN
jgi:hypothetical protein